MATKPKIPDDCKINIAINPEQEFWHNLKRKFKEELESLKNQMKFTKAVLEMIETKPLPLKVK